MSQEMTAQLTTFFLGSDRYGIEVMRVQEVTGKPTVIPVPLAPPFVTGLINLRGQIATAVGLRELFEMSAVESPSEMSVVCKLDGNLVSLLVDSIGDVMEVEQGQFEQAPETVPNGVRRLLKGIYKIEGSFISVLDLEKLSKELSATLESTEKKAA